MAPEGASEPADRPERPSKTPAAARARGRRSATWIVGGHLLALAFAMAAVWLPELRHWYVKPDALTTSQVSRALASNNREKVSSD